MIKQYTQIFFFFFEIITRSKGTSVIFFYLTSVLSQSSGPNPARLVVVSFSVQNQEGNLESSRLSGSQSPEHLKNSGAFQGIVPNGRKRSDIKTVIIHIKVLTFTLKQAENQCSTFFSFLFSDFSVRNSYHFYEKKSFYQNKILKHYRTKIFDISHLF